ncbi:IS607 family transposase [[Mycobacterium] zoologicum]|uniref:IS607 family transposase n=1 Tax=[Mycobacterium] zoologicum TaxID=2872311 RepID=UPI0039E1BD19
MDARQKSTTGRAAAYRSARCWPARGGARRGGVLHRRLVCVRLTELVGEVVTEVGSGLNGKRPKLRRILSDPSASVVVVEHRDRLARFGVAYLEAALSAQGRRIIVADQGETVDDLVRDMIEVLTSMCARLYGRRGARNRAMRAVTATKHAEGVG